MFKKLNDHLVSFIEAQWILCNILNVRCKQSCRAFLQEFQGFFSLLGRCSACHWWKGSVTELGNASLGGISAGHLRAESHSCSLPTADTGTWGNCCLVKASRTSDWEKYVHATFMARPQTHLIFQLWHGPGFGIGLVSVNLINSSGGGKSDISTNIFWSVICLEAQVLWDLSDWYLYHWLLSLPCHIWGSHWIICNDMFREGMKGSHGRSQDSGLFRRTRCLCTAHVWAKKWAQTALCLS